MYEGKALSAQEVFRFWRGEPEVSREVPWSLVMGMAVVVTVWAGFLAGLS